MNDDFLSQFRKAPRPEFSRSLHERLRRQSSDEPDSARSPISRWSPALAALGGVAFLAFLFSFPAVQAAAQDFLDLFRVKRFAAIAVDPVRLAQLKRGDLDIKALLSDDIEVLKEPGEPQIVDSLETAGQLAGIVVREPAVLPYGTGEPEVRVSGEGTARLTADTAKLQFLLNALEISDVEVPERLDGATITVNAPPSVVMRYKRGSGSLVFVQSRSPEIALPEGVDLAQLGEIGLRIAGMTPEEARTFAQSIDWHSTLLVPVPADAASFREVNVQGNPGLLITRSGKGGAATQPHANAERHRSTVLWSDGDMVYALMGGVSDVDLVEMANSIQ